MPHSQPTALQQTVCKFHLDPQYHIFHWGSTILGDSTLWIIIIIIIIRIIIIIIIIIIRCPMIWLLWLFEGNQFCNNYIFSSMWPTSPYLATWHISPGTESGKSSVSPIDATLFSTTVVVTLIPISHFTWLSGGDPSTISLTWFSPVCSSPPPPFLSSISRQILGKR